MATTPAPISGRPLHPVVRPVVRLTRSLQRTAVTLGDHFIFYARVLGNIVTVLILRRRYGRQVLTHMSEVTVGVGGLFLGGGLLVSMTIMVGFVGGEAGLQGYKALETLGAEQFSGIIGSFSVTRILVALIGGLAYAGQVGAGFTAELGAKRISEEVDALEVSGVNSLAYLVSTRVVAGLAVMVPLYFIALFLGFVGVELVVVRIFGVSEGLYNYYFSLYLPPLDILYSGIQIAVIIAAVTLVHCYYGYYATGGPAGVGVAAGRATRTSLILVATLTFVMNVIFWGTGETVSLTG